MSIVIKKNTVVLSSADKCNLLSKFFITDFWKAEKIQILILFKLQN